MNRHCPNHPNQLAKRRGVCLKCYLRIHKRIQRGQTTWEAEIYAGRVLPQQKRGRPRKAFKPVA
jgi:hypothetical protein